MIIGAVVVWKVADPTIRNIAMMYPYDLMDDDAADSEKTLRGSAQEIAESMREELAARVKAAGLEIEGKTENRRGRCQHGKNGHRQTWRG